MHEMSDGQEKSKGGPPFRGHRARPVLSRSGQIDASKILILFLRPLFSRLVLPGIDVWERGCGLSGPDGASIVIQFHHSGSHGKGGRPNTGTSACQRLDLPPGREVIELSWEKNWIWALTLAGGGPQSS